MYLFLNYRRKKKNECIHSSTIDDLTLLSISPGGAGQKDKDDIDWNSSSSLSFCHIFLRAVQVGEEYKPLRAEPSWMAAARSNRTQAIFIFG
jgi:hypothetical protein